MKLPPPIQVLISLHPWIEACISKQKAILEDTLGSAHLGRVEEAGWSSKAFVTVGKGKFPAIL